MSDRVCHICKCKCDFPNYTMVRVREAGDSFLAPVHRDCFEQHERAMLREAYNSRPLRVAVTQETARGSDP